MPRRFAAIMPIWLTFSSIIFIAITTLQIGKSRYPRHDGPLSAEHPAAANGGGHRHRPQRPQQVQGGL